MAPISEIATGSTCHTPRSNDHERMLGLVHGKAAMVVIGMGVVAATTAMVVVAEDAVATVAEIVVAMVVEIVVAEGIDLLDIIPTSVP